MKRRLAILAAAILAAGCASTGPPPDPKLFTDAELAVRGAESAGAPQFAPDLLGKARQALESARKASAAGDGEQARRRLLEAQAYARAAESRAKAEKIQGDSARLRREADELEAKAREIRERGPSKPQ